MRGLKDKVAIVTGGAGGIGSATCRRLVEEGAYVIIADINEEKASQLAEELGERAASCTFDMGQEDSIRAMIEFAVKSFGGIDKIVNTAFAANYMGPDTMTPFSDIDPEVYMGTMRINALGTTLVCKHAIPKMLHRGGGAIVNVSSSIVYMGQPCRTAYAASKGAIMTLSRQIATIYGKKGIRCNTILPGYIILKDLETEYPMGVGQFIMDNCLVPYHGVPEHIASAAAFLVSDDAAFINGGSLKVDGGDLEHYSFYADINRMEEEFPAFPRAII